MVIMVKRRGKVVVIYLKGSGADLTIVLAHCDSPLRFQRAAKF